MALEVQQQAKIWAIAGVVFLVVLWFLGDVVLPFVLGGAIAYCLDPVADRLEKIGLSRTVATTIITLVAVLIFVIMALAVIPSLVEQAVALVNVAPQPWAFWRDLRFPSISRVCCTKDWTARRKRMRDKSRTANPREPATDL